MDILSSIPLSVIREKQAAIARLAPTLQYSLVPSRMGVYDHPQTRSVISNKISTGISTSTVWSPPLKDAVDVFVENILSVQLTSTLLKPMISKLECFEINTFNEYLRKYHEDFNGKQNNAWELTYQAVEHKKKRNIMLHRKVEETPQSLLKYMKNNHFDANTPSPWPQTEYFNGFYPKHMLEIGLIDIHKSELLQRFRNNVNIPYIKDMYK